MSASAARQPDDDRLRQLLADCRTELAAVRAQQEEWFEDLHRERRQKAEVERKLRALAVAVDRKLNEDAEADRGRRRRRDPRIAEIRESEQFRGPWYVRQYPEVVESGLSPAAHYLEIGAAKGYKPGPDFDPRSYVEDHPELAQTGENPLLHHLRCAAVARDEV